MEILKLTTIVLGASGFWKLLDVLIKLKGERKLKSAEAKHLFSSAQQNIVANWVEWSQKLEQRVKESEQEREKQTAEMEAIFKRQRERIRCLEQKVEQFERENRELKKQISELKITQS